MIATNFNDAQGPYRLRDLKNGRFQIHAMGGRAFEGTKLQIFKKAEEMGCEPTDLRFAVKELERLDHTYAEFGIYGHFLFTRRDSKSRVA